jgi:phage terminase large subunit
MIEVKIPKVFKPLDKPHRYKVMYGGRGSSKSWSVARKLILRAAQNKILILCTRELQKSIKQSVHRLITNQIDAMGLTSFFAVVENSIKGANGSEFIFLGTKHNPEEIKSTEGIDICWIEEAANVTEDSWDIIDPTIRKEGSEIWITFNTRFKFDHMYQNFIANDPPPGSWVKRVNHNDNPFFPPALKAQMDNMKVKDYEKYLYIWEGQLKQLAKGAIFGKQILEMRKSGRICNVPVLPNTEVHTFWDLGRNDHTAIWFMQNVGKEYRMIDYYEGRLQDIDHYCRIIKGTCTNSEIEKLSVTEEDNERRQGYIYGSHYMPHDVKHQMLGMSTPRKKQFEAGGVKPIVVVERISDKGDAISLGREKLASVWIDEKRCERGIDCLSNYRYQYNDDKDTHNQSPHHDWSSNGADAYMGMAQGFKDSSQNDDWGKLDYEDIEVA